MTNEALLEHLQTMSQRIGALETQAGEDAETIRLLKQDVAALQNQNDQRDWRGNAPPDIRQSRALYPAGGGATMRTRSSS